MYLHGYRAVITTILFAQWLRPGQAQPQAAPCADIENIIGDLGFVQGDLGPAVTSPVLRQLAAAVETSVLDLNALLEAIPACSGSKTVKRQNSAVCNALAKVTADLAQVASAWAQVLSATNLPRTFDVNGLVPFLDDAVNQSLPLVQAALAQSDGCAQLN
ncbi:hypothetical protein VTK73DRAFT_5554 [Phialemonium thermophilum]|uniref:Uncharacterized protein n=1 Tax=Phialemonium thermophilum TaxID=223376 RepID=A0ABR3XY24_9PEZI